LGQGAADALQAFMSRGYSTPAVLCLCALAFICGRFLDAIPGLPEAPSGVRRAHAEPPSGAASLAA